MSYEKVRSAKKVEISEKYQYIAHRMAFLFPQGPPVKDESLKIADTEWRGGDLADVISSICVRQYPYPAASRWYTVEMCEWRMLFLEIYSILPRTIPMLKNLVRFRPGGDMQAMSPHPPGKGEEDNKNLTGRVVEFALSGEFYIHSAMGMRPWYFPKGGSPDVFARMCNSIRELRDGPIPLEEKLFALGPDAESDCRLRIMASLRDAAAYIRNKDLRYKSCIFWVIRGGESITLDPLLADLRSGRRCEDFGTPHNARIRVMGAQEGATGGGAPMRYLFRNLQSAASAMAEKGILETPISMPYSRLYVLYSRKCRPDHPKPQQ